MREIHKRASLYLLAVICLAAVANAQDPVMMGLPQTNSMVYPAYSSYGSKPRPGQCSGVITAIWCKEDANGVLTDVAYLNTETGLQLPGCSGSDWTADYSKALFLAEGESIIKVATCKGKAPKRRFESVTCITDAGQKLVCGKNDTAHHDYDHGYDNGYGGHGGYYPTSPYSTSSPGGNALSATITSDKGTATGHRSSATRASSRASGADKSSTKSISNNPPTMSKGGDGAQADAPQAADDKDDDDSYVGYRDGDAPDAADKVYRAPSARTYVPYTRKAAKQALRKARRQAHNHREEAQYGSSSRTNRRLLLDEEEDEEAAQATASGYRRNRRYYPQYPRDQSKRRYYGQARCSIDEPADKAVWSSVPDWYLITADANGAFGLVGSGSSAYFVYNNTHYYKNRAAYVSDLAAVEADPSSLTYTPGYYYDQVDPLADFKLDCTGDNCVASVYGFCWNNHYNNTKPDGVTSNITVELGQNSTNCPKTPAEFQALNAQLALISQRLQQASGGVIDSVAWERYTPAQCTEDPLGLNNATISLQGIFVPGPGHTQQEVRDWLAPYVDTPEGLCGVELNGMLICDDTIIYVLPFTFDAVTGRRLLGINLLSPRYEDEENDSSDVDIYAATRPGLL